MEDTSQLVQISLTARAFIYFALFTFAGFLVIGTNERRMKSVDLFGLFLFGTGIFNLVMAFEWLFLFFL